MDVLARLLSPDPALSAKPRETADGPKLVGANWTVAVQEALGFIVIGSAQVVVKLNPGDVVSPNEIPLRTSGPVPVLERVITYAGL